MEEHTSRRADVFLREDGYVSCFARPFLEQHFDTTFGLSRKVGKQDRALVLLLQNPGWSDEQIRQTLNTTAKQMLRWTDYTLARIVQTRNKS